MSGSRHPTSWHWLSFWSSDRPTLWTINIRCQLIVARAWWFFDFFYGRRFSKSRTKLFFVFKTWRNWVFRWCRILLKYFIFRSSSCFTYRIISWWTRPCCLITAWSRSAPLLRLMTILIIFKSSQRVFFSLLWKTIHMIVRNTYSSVRLLYAFSNVLF